MLRVMALCSVKKNAISRSYADSRRRECKQRASSFEFKTVDKIVIGLIGTSLNVVCIICFKRNKSLHSIDAGKPKNKSDISPRLLKFRVNQIKAPHISLFTNVFGCTTFNQLGK